MSRKISVSIALAITLIAITVTFSITWIVSMQTFDRTVSSVTDLQAQYSKLAEIDIYVRGNLYGTINDDYLFDRMAAGYMNGIGDGNAIYYTADAYADLLAKEKGQLVGIGIEVERDTDGYIIRHVYEDSPAFEAGVKTGGRILAVNDMPAATITSLAALEEQLWGTPGSELALQCVYNLTEEETFNIRRMENYVAPTVQSTDMTDYTYIRISSFSTTTYAEFSYAVSQALANGSKGIAFDLRGTSGSFSSELYSIIDFVCSQGTIAESINNTETVRVLATSDAETSVEIPMVALVNENTSAAAELFAASIRDLAGGQIVGTQTAGHGTIQNSPHRLADGSAVSVTVAILQTGTGEIFDGVGLFPDVDSAPIDGFTETSLFSPNLSADPQIIRSFEVLQALVRETGEDPGSADAPKIIVDEDGNTITEEDPAIEDDSATTEDASDVGSDTSTTEETTSEDTSDAPTATEDGTDTEEDTSSVTADSDA